MTSHKTYESHYSREANERDKKTKEFLRNVYPDRLYFPVEDVPSGVEYRWVREEIRGQKDTSNVTLMCKQGWTPVPFSRHPHFLADTSWFKSEDPTVIRIDGLILCERPIEYGEIEREALRQQNAHALQAVNWTISQDHERDRRIYQNETHAPRVVREKIIEARAEVEDSLSWEETAEDFDHVIEKKIPQRKVSAPKKRSNKSASKAASKSKSSAKPDTSKKTLSLPTSKKGQTLSTPEPLATMEM